MVVSKSQQCTRRLSLRLPWVAALMASLMSFLSTDMSSRHFSSCPTSNLQLKYILYMPRKVDANLGVVLGSDGSLGCSALGVIGSFDNSCSSSRLGSCSMLPMVSLCAIFQTSDASMPACILPLLLAKSREVGLWAFFYVLCECLSTSYSLWTTCGELSCSCSIFSRLRKEYILQMAYSSCTLSLSGVSLFSNLSVSWMIQVTHDGDLSVCIAWWWLFPSYVWVCWSMWFFLLSESRISSSFSPSQNSIRRSNQNLLMQSALVALIPTEILFSLWTNLLTTAMKVSRLFTFQKNVYESACRSQRKQGERMSTST